MRHILCNYARATEAERSAEAARRMSRSSPDTTSVHTSSFPTIQTDTLSALDESLQALERIAERQARVVECRFFGGMSIEDTGAVLGMSPRTVKRDWTFARAWLRREVQLRLDTLD